MAGVVGTMLSGEVMSVDGVMLSIHLLTQEVRDSFGRFPVSGDALRYLPGFSRAGNF